MEFIHHLHNLQPGHRDCTLTIGNFDGVHLGHQAVLRQLRERARQLGLPAVLMMFEPQPLEFFSPSSAPARLTSLREKLLLFQQLGIERVFCLRFDSEIADLSAQQFVEAILITGLGCRHVVVGDDFKFGRGRSGNFATLLEYGCSHDFEVTPTETYCMDGERVSSSRIRSALAYGAFADAAALLGRPFRISGRVICGDQRGRRLGFPTANVDLQKRRSPVHGVFAVRVRLAQGALYDAVANVGMRPTVAGTRLLLEVHLLDFDEEIYGQRIEVEFLQRIRDEMKFASVEELQNQIRQDVDAAQSCLQPVRP